MWACLLIKVALLLCFRAKTISVVKFDCYRIFLFRSETCMQLVPLMKESRLYDFFQSLQMQLTYKHYGTIIFIHLHLTSPQFPRSIKSLMNLEQLKIYHGVVDRQDSTFRRKTRRN